MVMVSKAVSNDAYIVVAAGRVIGTRYTADAAVRLAKPNNAVVAPSCRRGNEMHYTAVNRMTKRIEAAWHRQR